MEGTARLREMTPATGGDYVSTYDCVTGAMRARCEIQHPVGRSATGPAEFGSIDDVLCDAATRYYGTGFTTQRHRISGVGVDLVNLRASGSVSIEPAGAVPAEGIDGARQPSVSLVDCFVTNLQLAQILMYELDSIRRQDSNTLWMLKTVLETSSPYRPWSPPLVSSVAITGKHQVPLRGAMWRNVGRAVAEAQLGDTFVSDGSSLQEWLYGAARVLHGMNPTATAHTDHVAMPVEMAFFEEVVAQFGFAFKQHVKQTYDAFVHLRHELPITDDGHRPMNEKFRTTIDEMLLSTLDELRIPVHVVSGSFTDRLATIVDLLDLLDLPTVRGLDEAVALANADYARLDLRLETDRALSA